MPLRAVLFDLDNTLHDKSATLGEMARRHFARARPRPISLEVWRGAYLGLNQERLEKAEVFRRLAFPFNLSEDVQKELLEDFDAHLGQIAKPFPGALELLQGCRALGLKTGIVTNGRDAFQRSKIQGMGADAWVDFVVTSGGLGVKKPDAAIFHACLQSLGVQARDAAFVGDDFEADMVPARALGMHTVWKGREHSPAVDFASDDLREILGHLRDRAGQPGAAG